MRHLDALKRYLYARQPHVSERGEICQIGSISISDRGVLPPCLFVCYLGFAMKVLDSATAPPGMRDRRLTKIQSIRLSWDYIIAAHYYYTPRSFGFRAVADLFEMPLSTVRLVVQRTPKSDPGVQLAAERWGLVPRIIELPPRLVREVPRQGGPE